MSLLTRRKKCNELIRRYYHDVPSREKVLDQAISENLESSHVILDAGCGSDFPILSRHAPNASLALGIDVCPPKIAPVGTINVLIGNLEHLPIQAGSVDMVFSRSVVEHLDNPVQVFQEFNRVLRPGGKVVFTTPNKYYYSSIIASMTPDWVKALYFKTVFADGHYDYFPVRYRANTERAMNILASATGFKIRKVEALRHYPFYLVFSPILFRLGIFYDQLITAWGLRWLQSTWLVIMEKN
jgi:SAM-dependent methyltransferase